MTAAVEPENDLRARPPIRVVDDRERLPRLVVTPMTRIGFREVEGVGSAAEALERLRARRHALVICDRDGEPMDGLGLRREIRAAGAPMNIPFMVTFMVTEASFDFDDIGRAPEADAFILKPFDAAMLKAKLRQVLIRRPRRRWTPMAAGSSLGVDFPMLEMF